MALEVELVSPERIAYSGEARMVICRTTTGDIAFLPGHIPFIGVLATHPVRLQLEDGSEKVIAVHQGFVEVSPPDEQGNTEKGNAFQRIEAFRDGFLNGLDGELVGEQVCAKYTVEQASDGRS